MISTAQTELFEKDVMGELNRIKIDLLNSGHSLIDLSMINPDIPPQRYLLDKLSEATIKSSNHRYSVSRGIRKLRQAFSSKYEQRFGVDLDPESEVCVTMGTKDALFNLLLCTASPGDVALLASPTYPAHLSACRLAGLRVEYFPLLENESEMLSAIEQQISTVSPRIIIFNFPNNPTGLTVSHEFFSTIQRITKDRDILLVNDFVYGEMAFDRTAQPSLLAGNGDKGNRSEIYSLSKAYCVPGWRIGALMGDSEVVGRLSRLKSHIDYGVFLPLQIAAAAGLTSSQDLIGDVVMEYHKRARSMCRGLAQLGWQVTMPKAGASVWAAPPQSMTKDSGSLRQMARNLLEQESILVMPGELFGSDSTGYVRFALVTGHEQMHNVIERLERFGSH